MTIQLENLGKRYHKEWIFKNLTYNFQANKSYAVTGCNGSGKSTLMRAIAGIMPLTKGSVIYNLNNQTVAGEDIFKRLTFSAPYLELPEELTLKELIQFHFSLRKVRPDVDKSTIIERMQLSSAENKYIHDFSSGMKQRVNLGLALYTSSPLILLDEPTSNLDLTGVNWYLEEVMQLHHGHTIIIASNKKEEYNFCDQVIDIANYKFESSKKIKLRQTNQTSFNH